MGHKEDLSIHNESVGFSFNYRNNALIGCVMLPGSALIGDHSDLWPVQIKTFDAEDHNKPKLLRWAKGNYVFSPDGKPAFVSDMIGGSPRNISAQAFALGLIKPADINLYERSGTEHSLAEMFAILLNRTDLQAVLLDRERTSDARGILGGILQYSDSLGFIGKLSIGYTQCGDAAIYRIENEANLDGYFAQAYRNNLLGTWKTTIF